MRQLKRIVEYVGSLGILFMRTLRMCFTPPFKIKALIEQMSIIGVGSFLIVFLTALFTGMVLAFQMSHIMQKMGAEMYIASLVGLSVTRELGPVLTALVVSARVGASITAELGTMKVTEQIDALEALAVHPVKYLVVPRFLALCLTLPLLTIYADIIGILGGFGIAVSRLHLPARLYLKRTFDFLEYRDIYTGILKSLIFAAIISIVACYHGMKTRGGAEGVGKSTTLSVVISCILVIAFDCVATAFFYFVF
ncbi:MAG: ABC transporter permease [Candidatus Omnitrophota bacterium]|nr:MAG: ABC transporter permease [Candidatus Omnitrophota bacterium]